METKVFHSLHLFLYTNNKIFWVLHFLDFYAFRRIGTILFILFIFCSVWLLRNSFFWFLLFFVDGGIISKNGSTIIV
jgi:hypothetical protein